MASKSSNFLERHGYDLVLGSIAALYVFMAPYTKVEESFNVQAMHDILYYRNRIDNYDHLEFPGVVPRTFLGALFVSSLASPSVLAMELLHLPKVHSLLAVRLVLGGIILSTLCFFRLQVRHKFGRQVEAFFVILTAVQFHLLFYCTRPLPNILALGVVNLAYGYWLKEKYYAAINCLIFATVIFRCDILLLLGPLGLELLLFRPYCYSRFNYVEKIHPFYWYFTSALPRSLLAAYPLFLLGVLLERRVLLFVLPALSFVLLYSKLPHKELRFIISSVPMFNLSAAIAATRIYNNRKKTFWNLLYPMMLGLLLISLGCTVISFMASNENYPSGHALKHLHQTGHLANSSNEHWVHIDTFSAMNGISRFCENNFPWRYSKEEGIPPEELHRRNFTYLINEHPAIDGFKCLFAVNGFSRVRLRTGFPPVLLPWPLNKLILAEKTVEPDEINPISF
ncbi:hypothetical protein DVH24_013908 [Malus domestica]|uniref:Mannosyltransferase n=1 Tax=Malus domestica TaxID=3750 RepID=A0A498JI15_MALDO|nr:hypothetical protein DVH24_013908 [Malus domestica]